MGGILTGSEVDAPVAAGRRSGQWRPFVLNSLYLGGLLFAVPYLVCRGRTAQLVDHARRRFRSVPLRRGRRPCVWIHGVSVGEIFSTRKLLQKVVKEFPDWEPVISTTTRAGLEVAQRAFPGQAVFSYPFDLSFLVRKAFDRIRPDLVIIVEHELWPNFLGHAEARGVPVAIVNGRLSSRSLKGYRWLSRFLTWPPPGIVRFCVEDELSAEGFRGLGVAPDRICVTGNLKFDNTSVVRDDFRSELGLNGDWVLVAASTHKGEEAVLLDSFRPLRREDQKSRLIIAPRRIERVDELRRLARRQGFKTRLWSETRAQNGTSARGPLAPDDEVVLVDTVGEIPRISSVGDVVFVGGSLVPFGGHNVIEPASLGRPVVIGPHYQNFRHVVTAFTDRDALLVADSGEDLARKLRELKSNPGHATAVGQRASETISLHSGASDRTIDALRPLFERVATGQEVSSD